MLHTVFTYSLINSKNIYEVRTILRNCGSKSDPSANEIDKTLAFFFQKYHTNKTAFVITNCKLQRQHGKFSSYSSFRH